VSHFRTSIAIFSLAAVLLAVLAPGAHGLAPALPAQFWLFLDFLALVSLRRRTQDRKLIDRGIIFRAWKPGTKKPAKQKLQPVAAGSSRSRG
jgi:hypothetical protein